jgi:hypothetical protein
MASALAPVTAPFDVRAKGARKILPAKSAEPIEKSRFERENPRKSKTIQYPSAGVFAAKRPRAKTIQTDQKSVGWRRHKLHDFYGILLDETEALLAAILSFGDNSAALGQIFEMREGRKARGARQGPV